VDDQYNNPTLAGNLAEASIEAADRDFTGILHLAGPDYLSRYEIAVQIAAYYGLPNSLISKVTTDVIGQKANRPHHGGLKINKAKSILKTRLLKLKDGLSRLDI
jgi:dTDP-4-dehydrorhamnose reductase